MTCSSMEMTVGISLHSLAYLTGVTVSWGSRSTCMCSIKRQNEARNSYGNISSDIHLSTEWSLSIKHFKKINKYCSQIILSKIRISVESGNATRFIRSTCSQKSAVKIFYCTLVGFITLLKMSLPQYQIYVKLSRLSVDR